MRVPPPSVLGLGPTGMELLELFPSPRGLLLGLGCVVVGQVAVLAYYFVRRSVFKSQNFIQYSPPPTTTLADDLYSHITSPESFMLVFGYLTTVWMLNLLPPAYYVLGGSVSWWQVLLQLLVVDAFTYIMHRIEHAWAWLYIRSHKKHHHWINPRLYNAFSACVNDTVTLILIPLFLTSRVCQDVNTYTFAAFGTIYASQFTLIHCEFSHPWDPLFKLLGVGTAEDHNVHHAAFNWNYGHFFMYYDWIFGTYRDGKTLAKMRSSHSKSDPKLVEKSA